MHSIKINNFLNIFDDLLFNTKLFECDGGSMKSTIHGNHMETCVWSNYAATEGVDTCVCHRISDYKKEALNIMIIDIILKKE